MLCYGEGSSARWDRPGSVDGDTTWPSNKKTSSRAGPRCSVVSYSEIWYKTQTIKSFLPSFVTHYIDLLIIFLSWSSLLSWPMNSGVSISHPSLGLIIQSFRYPSYFPSHTSPYAISWESLIAHDGVPTMSSSSYLWRYLSKDIPRYTRHPGFFKKFNDFEDILAIHERREGLW